MKTAAMDPAEREALEARRKTEKTFARKLSKAGWYTYKDQDGRLVTNAFHDELSKLVAISGIPCEVLSPGAKPGELVRIGPCL